MFFWNSLAFSVIQWMLATWTLVPLPSCTVETQLEGFWHHLTSMWHECNCTVVWTFFGIAFLWDWSENWQFNYNTDRPIYYIYCLWLFHCCTNKVELQHRTWSLQSQIIYHLSLYWKVFWPLLISYYILKLRIKATRCCTTTQASHQLLEACDKYST